MRKFQILIALVTMLLWNYHGFGQTVQPDERGYIVKVGDRVEDFRLEFADGSSKLLSDFKAPVIVLNFFASWCVVCRQEIPHIENELWQPMKDQGLIVLGIDYKEKPEVAQNFAREMNISYPVVLDRQGKIFDRFARGGVTRNIVLDQNLHIIYLTRLFNPSEFEGMKKIVARKLGLNPDSTGMEKKEEIKMNEIFLKDDARIGKKILVQYQGKHAVHLEGRIKRKRWWRKLEIEISLFKEDIATTKYDKKTHTLRIGYRHYPGVRIQILPMTTLKVPRNVEQIIVYDVNDVKK